MGLWPENNRVGLLRFCPAHDIMTQVETPRTNVYSQFDVVLVGGQVRLGLVGAAAEIETERRLLR